MRKLGVLCIGRAGKGSRLPPVLPQQADWCGIVSAPLGGHSTLGCPQSSWSDSSHMSSALSCHHSRRVPGPHCSGLSALSPWRDGAAHVAVLGWHLRHLLAAGRRGWSDGRGTRATCVPCGPSYSQPRPQCEELCGTLLLAALAGLGSPGSPMGTGSWTGPAPARGGWRWQSRARAVLCRGSAALRAWCSWLGWLCRKEAQGKIPEEIAQLVLRCQGLGRAAAAVGGKVAVPAATGRLVLVPESSPALRCRQPFLSCCGAGSQGRGTPGSGPCSPSPGLPVRPCGARAVARSPALFGICSQEPWRFCASSAQQHPPSHCAVRPVHLSPALPACRAAGGAAPASRDPRATWDGAGHVFTHLEPVSAVGRG